MGDGKRQCSWNSWHLCVCFHHHTALQEHQLHDSATLVKVPTPNPVPRALLCVVCCPVQLLTRLFRFDDKDILLPVVDFANHDNTCQHSHLPEPCDPEQGFRQWQQNLRSPPLASTAGSGVYGAAAAKSNSSVSGQCIVWRAETPLKAGQEVCNSYKTLLQDRALLQYGFLQVSLDLETLNPNPQTLSAPPTHADRPFPCGPQNAVSKTARSNAQVGNDTSRTL